VLLDGITDMCGIVGCVYVKPEMRSPLSQEVMTRLAHRGPDGSGHYEDRYVQLGHTRLSIIDLSDAGHQPMLSRDSR
jgi:asparagine synthase (glutamine-hydrolysing)